jgi:hypothetical protein
LFAPEDGSASARLPPDELLLLLELDPPLCAVHGGTITVVTFAFVGMTS